MFIKFIAKCCIKKRRRSLCNTRLMSFSKANINCHTQDHIFYLIIKLSFIVQSTISWMKSIFKIDKAFCFQFHEYIVILHEGIGCTSSKHIN